MKKAVKALITAAAVAAVVGVGAVSFAEWQAGSTEPKSVSGTSGSIIVMGSLTAETDLNGKLLVPYDQSVQFNDGTMAKEMNITLGYSAGANSGSGTPTITMTAKGTLAEQLEWENGSENWETFDDGVTVTTGTIKIRLNSSNTADMSKDWEIEFTAAA